MKTILNFVKKKFFQKKAVIQEKTVLGVQPSTPSFDRRLSATLSTSINLPDALTRIICEYAKLAQYEYEDKEIVDTMVNDILPSNKQKLQSLCITYTMDRLRLEYPHGRNDPLYKEDLEIEKGKIVSRFLLFMGDIEALRDFTLERYKDYYKKRTRMRSEIMAQYNENEEVTLEDESPFVKFRWEI